MILSRWLLLSAAFLLAPAHAADPAKAKELMSLSNTHGFVAGTIKYGMRRKQEAAGLTDAQLACVDTISPARFADVVTAEIAARLSDAEIAAGIEFYRTPSAQKMVTFVAARLNGESVDNPYNAADVENIEKFMASPAGTKLAAVGQSESVTQKMADVTGDTIENCGKPKTP